MTETQFFYTHAKLHRSLKLKQMVEIESWRVEGKYPNLLD